MNLYSQNLTTILWKQATAAKSTLHEIYFNFCVILMEREKNWEKNPLRDT